MQLAIQFIVFFLLLLGWFAECWQSVVGDTVDYVLLVVFGEVEWLMQVVASCNDRDEGDQSYINAGKQQLVVGHIVFLS